MSEHYYLPPPVAESLKLYAEQGVPTGDFLRACLANDLKESIARADHINVHHIRDIVMYMYNDMPSVCWGSYEKVDTWINLKALERKAKERE